MSTAARPGEVEKCIELSATGSSVEGAVSVALERASLTLEGITGFHLEDISGEVCDAGIVFKVRLRVSFRVLERFHQ